MSKYWKKEIINFFRELVIVNLLIMLAIVLTNGIVSFFDEPLKIGGCVALMVVSSIIFFIVSLIEWIVSLNKNKDENN